MLENKKIAVTGATGGIGRELCKKLIKNSASLVLIGRNQAKLKALNYELGNTCEILLADMENLDSIEPLSQSLVKLDIDILVINAGAYKIPRQKTDGFENVFVINFLYPYKLTKKLLGHLNNKNGKIVAVGSIAHTYGKFDQNDIDYSTRKGCAKVYGNSKRVLMAAMYELLKDQKAKLSLCHPGITLTNITSHYPKALFWIMKPIMKVIFISPKKAADCLLAAIEKGEEDNSFSNFAPKYFGIWGKPKLRKIKTINESERKEIFNAVER